MGGIVGVSVLTQDHPPVNWAIMIHKAHMYILFVNNKGQTFLNYIPHKRISDKQIRKSQSGHIRAHQGKSPVRPTIPVVGPLTLRLAAAAVSRIPVSTIIIFIITFITISIIIIPHISRKPAIATSPHHHHHHQPNIHQHCCQLHTTVGAFVLMTLWELENNGKCGRSNIAPVSAEVPRSSPCSGVKGVIPANRLLSKTMSIILIFEVDLGQNLLTLSSRTNLSSCQALPRAPPSGHRGSELWDNRRSLKKYWQMSLISLQPFPVWPFLAVLALDY